jgi:hypothetical protein
VVLQKVVAPAALQGAPLGSQNLDNGTHPKSLQGRTGRHEEWILPRPKASVT